MIDLHYWSTPNGLKILICLVEMELDYRITSVNIGRGEQFEPEFIKISPNNRIPAIIDFDPPEGREPISVFESGAILLYLGSKTAKFLPKDLHKGTEVREWLMWQMGGLGPMLGQNHYFRLYAKEKLDHAIERYTNEANRLYAVLDRRLEGREWISDEYSIADMASYPWIRGYPQQGIDMAKFPNVDKWRQRMEAREAVMKAIAIDVQFGADKNLKNDDEAHKIMFSHTDEVFKPTD